MIALTQVLLEYSLIIPVLKYNNQEIQFTFPYFALLVLSTVLIAAGGYIINDYADVEIDKINKPEKLVIGKHISLNRALNIYAFLSLIGIALALFIALHVQFYVLVFIQVIVAGLLYFYAFNYKSQFLIGNIIIALLAALTILLPFIYETIAEVKQLSFKYIYFDIAYIYAGFAFLTTLIREIIKDAEDIEGDQTANCQTLPIVIGINFTKIILTFLLCILLVSITYFQYQLYLLNQDVYSQVYIILFIQFPILFLIFKLLKAQAKYEFSFASLIIKLIMLAGTLSLPILFILIYKLSE
ncbi:MAG: hypothetical protein A3K10_06765 [Bacteroidetes bacterium RIFCSPLOWO2_12_FULL_31_6]|nr:MAG: hypothetical protein A3K10_06765 [Bacteroidetes bacterium RIFCSPLOWO2_12_FULL_31_6]